MWAWLHVYLCVKTGLDPKVYGTHSLRGGGSIAARKRGFSSDTRSYFANWKSETTRRNYKQKVAKNPRDMMMIARQELVWLHVYLCVKTGLDPKVYGTHSLRGGGSIAARKRGFSSDTRSYFANWKSETTRRNYKQKVAK
eukprot:554818_1